MPRRFCVAVMARHLHRIRLKRITKLSCGGLPRGVRWYVTKVLR
jgi:hypothetical protein